MRVTLWIYRWKELRQGIQFEVPLVIERLREAFPDIVVDNRDYFAERAAFLHGSAAETVAKADADHSGPGYRFFIPSIDSRGSIEKYSITFWREGDFDPLDRERIAQFLQSFGINEPAWS